MKEVNMKLCDGRPEMVRTPRGMFYVADATVEEMRGMGYGEHHRSSDGKYAIMVANNEAYAVKIS